MIEYLDGTDLLNEVRLLLSGGISRIVVVEGEDDYDLLEELFVSIPATLVPGYGKPKTLQAARLAEVDAVEDIRFLVDADFDRLTGASDDYPANVFASAHYDLAVDLMVVAPETIHRIARLATGKNQGKSVVLAYEDQVALALSLASELGAFRYASERAAWGLNFENFPHHMGVPVGASASLDVSAVASLLVARTRLCSLAPGSVESAAKECLSTTVDRMVLINGHDLLAILLVVGTRFGAAKSNTGYETQFKLVAASEVERVAVVAEIAAWAKAA